MKMFLQGQWQDSEEKIEVVNPYDNSVIDTVPSGNAEHVGAALATLVEGARVMRAMSAYDRCGLLRKTAQLMRERMEDLASTDGDPAGECLALIWQGHTLDLQGKRAEAIERYRRAAEMELDDTWSHGQYGMKYQLSPHARARLETPFVRIINQDLS